jgi:Protein of unknown function (DUF1553)/Protein of unknown function (DUF1549)
MPQSTSHHPSLVYRQAVTACVIATSLAAVCRAGVDPDAARAHWAFHPVRVVAPPANTTAGKDRNPIDLFLEVKLRDEELTPVGRADKRTLIRRATFDLTGLPPTPQDVEAFVADDAPDAYTRLIDRLLASPHYGERWGRHWLDVVRYADTAGETADFPVPDAWRYRNYVIDAFNQDKPYDQFIREQLAGDLLAKKLPADAPTGRYAELVTATGYIAIARRFGFDIEKDHYLTLDDTIDTLGKSLLGLTIGCARCHDHKYDPISVRDYYAMYGIFESTRYPYPGCEKTKQPRDLVPLLSPDELRRTAEPFNQAKMALEQQLKEAAGAPDQTAKALDVPIHKSARLLAEGAIDRAGKQAFADGAKAALDAIDVKKGEAILLSIDPRGDYGADSTRVSLVITEADGEHRQWDVTKDVIDNFLAGNPHADGQGHSHAWSFVDLRGGMRLLDDAVRDHSGKPGLNIWRRGDTPSAWVNSTDKPIEVWTVLPPRTFFMHPAKDGAVGLVWLSPIDGRVQVTGEVADAHPQQGNGIAWRIEQLQTNIADGVAALADADAKSRQLRQQLADLDAKKPAVEYAYAVAEGQPHDAQIHVRGDPDTRGDVVTRRNLAILGGQTLADPSSSGRLELAEWLASPDNPLTARVMVNRIWQHHFGRGLVATTNNFGLRGEPPTHPQLLDYLARYFIGHGWSVKAMHRLIMMSDAYRRSSVVPDGDESGRSLAAHDPDNRWLSRFSRRRLSAEEIRDAVLAVSGRLDATPGRGHPFPPQQSWGFTQHNPFSAVYDSNKRSVYLMTQRIRRHPFLGLFDGADTAASTGERVTTTVPTQALFFMNNPFLDANADHLAAALSPMRDDATRLDRAFRLLFGRPPTADDQAGAMRFLNDYAADLPDVSAADRPRVAWSAWLRVMMSSNEFLYVD